MALYLLERSGGGAEALIDGVRSLVLEATAKELASALYHGDSSWSDASVTELVAGTAADYAGWPVVGSSFRRHTSPSSTSRSRAVWNPPRSRSSFEPSEKGG
jgi:hypothetical protein